MGCIRTLKAMEAGLNPKEVNFAISEDLLTHSAEKDQW